MSMSSTVFYASSSEPATLTNTFSVSGTPTDPTTVTLAVTSPSGTTSTYTYAAAEITKSSTGVFTKDIACSEAGEWRYVWTGTGTAADVVSGSWTVFLSDAKLYCSAEAVRSRFRISDALDDHEIARAVRAASRRIDSLCGRERFWRDATVQARVFHADNGRCCRIPVGVSTVTGLVVKTDEDGDGTFERTLTIDTDFFLEPFNAVDRYPAWPYESIHLADNYSFPVHANGRAGVQVTARFGWPAIPDDISEAALILAHRLFKRKETANGVVGFDAIGATVRLSREDPDVTSLLAPYVVFGIA